MVLFNLNLLIHSATIIITAQNMVQFMMWIAQPSEMQWACGTACCVTHPIPRPLKASSPFFRVTNGNKVTNSSKTSLTKQFCILIPCPHFCYQQKFHIFLLHSGFIHWWPQNQGPLFLRSCLLLCLNQLSRVILQKELGRIFMKVFSSVQKGSHFESGLDLWLNVKLLDR